MSYVTNYNFLGIIFDVQLNFHGHSSLLFDKLKKLLQCFYYLRPYVIVKILKTEYKSLGKSILRYGVKIWGGTSMVHLNRLKFMQVGLRIMHLAFGKRHLTENELLKVFHTMSSDKFYSI